MLRDDKQMLDAWEDDGGARRTFGRRFESLRDLIQSATTVRRLDDAMRGTTDRLIERLRANLE